MTYFILLYFFNKIITNLWARLGYSMEQAGELAATTAKLLNVSEFTSVDEATSALVSSLQAFTTEGQDVGQRAEEIVDILNHIGNRYPVATNELADGLATSSAALVAANNSIEEQVALLSAGNATMQDISTVASGLKIVAARLRGTTTDIDDDADSAITNVSKLQSKIKALTAQANGGEGIDIINEKGEYKSTYEILAEISKIFDKMDDVSSASLLELIAGKNRSSVVAAILQNGDILENAYADAFKADFSAQNELDNYLDSIQGRIDLFNNSVQTMWMNLIDSEVIKNVVDLGTELIKLVDTLGLVPTALAVFAGFKLLTKPIGLIGDLNGALKGTITLQNLANAVGQKKIATDTKLAMSIALADTALVQYAITSGLVTAEQVAQMTTTELLGVAFMGLAVKIKTAAAALWTFLTTTPLGWATIAITAIAGVVTAYEHFTISHEEYIEQLETETEALRSVQSELKNVQSELETTKDRIDELNAKESLSFVEQEELDRLKEQNAELERQEKILQEREARSKQKQAETALNALKTDPNFKDKFNTDQQYGSSYAATSGLSQTGSYVSTTPYAAGQQAQQSTTKIENIGNNFEIALKNLKAAQDELATTNAELENAANLDTEAYDVLVKKQTDASAKVAQYNNELDALFVDWETKYRDVGYFDAPTTEDQKALNEFVRQYEDYVDQQRLINGDIGKSDILDRVFGRTGTDLAKEFKEKFEADIKAGGDPSQVIADLLSGDKYAPLLNDLQTKFGIAADVVNAYFTQVGQGIVDATKDAVYAVKTYSDIVADVEAYNDALSKSAEILSDNTEISEDYYNALKAQLADITVGTEEFSDAIKEQNGKYIVKNVALLKKLVNQSKKAKKATIEVAKSQAQLQYRDIVDQMRNAITIMGVEYDAYGFITDATFDNISAMREQIDTLKQTIQQYALLEVSLSDAASAYDEYEAAKERDAQLSYDESFSEMLKTIDEGLLKNETGSEAFEYSVRAVVPEVIWSGIEDPNEKVKAIHDYIDGDKTFSKLFHVDEESGELDVNTDNVREFIKLSKEAGMIVGGPEGFGLDKTVYGTKEWAKALNTTEAAVLALLSATEDCDALWGNILTDVMTHPLDREINKSVDEVDEATKALEDYFKSVQSGDEEFKSDHYNELVSAVGAATDKLKENQQVALDNAQAYNTVQAAISSFRGDLSLTDDEAANLVSSLKEIDGLEDLGEIEIQDGQLKLTDEQLTLILGKLGKITEPSVVQVQLRYDEISSEIDQINEYIKNNCTGRITIDGINFIGGKDKDGNSIEDYLAKLTAEQKEIQLTYNITETSTEEEKSVLESYQEMAKNGVQFTVTAIVDDAKEGLDSVSDAQKNIKEKQTITFSTNASTVEQAIKDFADEYDRISSKVITLTVNVEKKEIASSVDPNPAKGLPLPGKGIGGQTKRISRALGNARANGTPGLNTAEHDAIVGEIGPELVVDPIKGVYYTVGENGTEMVNLPKGAIIYNHKQTEELLRNGHTTRGRYTGGLSFAKGNAYADYGIPSYHPNLEDETSFKNGTGVNTTWDDAASTLTDAMSDAADSVGEFEETIDWIAIRMEEYDEIIGKLSAQLENLATVAEKNAKIDEIVAKNQEKLADVRAGAAYYEEHAQKYLAGMNDDLVRAAKNGAIAITEFTKEQDEATVNAINNYRDYAQKAADLYQQAEEILTDIRNSVIQKIDNIKDYGSAKTSIEDAQTEKLQNRVDLDEAMGEITSPAYYEAMMENSGKKIEYWKPLLENMQKEFDKAVEDGQIKVGSVEWYEQLAKLYEVQAEIDAATIELEEFQNSINDIYWDNFDQLINRIEYLKDETQSLIDLMGNEDMVITPETEGGWTADDVKWTDEGLASLGLYAQQMEIAEFEARQYAEAIDQLTSDYEAGKYSENEYLEKLNELKSAQYDAIDAYNDSKEAIVDLNEARIDAIKEGIEKEIDAYSELIEKQKEALDAEKDLHDFQKSVMDQQKDIADLERQLAALAGDNSASARAKRAKLEAELAEANEELNETYYDRSVSNQQEALDKELENFKEEKEKEMEDLELYLENVEQVVADSLMTVQANATTVYDTLNAKADEYNLNLSESILAPWKDGSLAVSDYQSTFDSSMSSTMDQLDALKAKWQEVIDTMQEAAKVDVNNINATNANYADAKEIQNTTDDQQQQQTQDTTTKAEEPQKPSLTKGSYIEVKSGTKWYADSYGGGASGNAKSGTIKYINESGSYPYNIDGLGWVKKTDIKGYAKGTKNLDKSGIINVDELGEELVLRAHNGRLTYMEKGSGVIPADLTANLMEWGRLDPSIMLDSNRPKVNVHPEIRNTEIKLDCSVGTLLHIDEFNGDNPEDIAKLVAKEFDKHTKNLNNALRKYAR